MKRIIIFFLGIFSLLPAFSQTFYYTYEGQTLLYCINDSLEVSVTANGMNSAISGDVVIPSYVTYEQTEYVVTRVVANAFSCCSGLTSVIIPNSVKEIGDYAFYGCGDLTSIELPNSITSISYGAFYGCSGLTSIEIPNSVTSIGNDAFFYCSSLTSVIIPNSVISIGRQAFAGCSGLTSINIPNSVTSIEFGVFSSCSGLTSVIIPNSVTSIEYRVFYGCTGLTSIDIPNSVTSIGNDAFYGCSGLTSVIIPNSVTGIGDYAFCGCSGLTSVIIPNFVTYIGDKAFYGCNSLIKCAYPNTLENPFNRGLAISYEPEGAIFEDGLIYGAEKSSLLFAPHALSGNFIIPNSVKEIGDYAFYGCGDLTSIELPNSITSISYGVFSRCTGLTSIDIPNSVTSIGNDAFFYCSSLTSVIIPNSVISIGNDAFYGCSGLTSVNIPNSVTSIEEGVFSNCSGLTSVIIPNSVTSIKYGVFYGCTGLTSIDIPNSVTSIGNDAFFYCSSLTSVIIPNSVISIGWQAFAGCSGLTSIIIPNFVTYIGDKAFYGCNSLIKCAYPNTLENPFYKGLTIRYEPEGAIFEDGLIYGAEKSSLLFAPHALSGNFIIPNSVKEIGDYAFYGCGDLTSIELPNSITSISYGAFYGCSGLTSIEIPNSVTSIGRFAFSGCTGLTSIEIPNSVKIFFSSTLNGCDNLNYIKFADGEEELNVCYDSGSDSPPCCKKLYMGRNWSGFKFQLVEEVIIGDCVTSIPDNSFYNCDNLKYLQIGNSVSEIGQKAFYGCTGIKSLMIPPCVNSLWLNTFDGMNLNRIAISAGFEKFDIPSQNTIWYDPRGAVAEAGFLYGNDKKSLIFAPDNIEGEYYVPEITEKIGDFAFYGCSSLDSLFIPAKTNYIGRDAFGDCNLSVITVDATKAPVMLENSFANQYATAQVSVPEESMLDYMASNWALFDSLKCKAEDSNLRTATDGTFNYLLDEDDMSAMIVAGDYSQIQTADIPDSFIDTEVSGDIYKVKYIGYGAFANCSSLRSLSLNNAHSLEKIGDSAFSGCNRLNSIEFNNNLRLIGNSAFKGCYKLTDLSFGAELCNIEAEAFSGCNQLSNIKFNDNLISIGNKAFYNCQSLIRIDLNDKLENVGYGAFYGCKSMKSVEIPASVSVIDDYAFNSTVKDIRFNDGTLPIFSSEDAFSYSGLTDLYLGRPLEVLFLKTHLVGNLTIGNEVRNIPPRKFKNFSIKKLQLGAKIEKIGAEAFYSTYEYSDYTDYGWGINEFEIVLPPSVEYIGSKAFWNNTRVKSVKFGQNVKSIGEDAFGNMTLTTIYITAPEPPAALVSTFNSYAGFLYVQGEDAYDKFYDAEECWDRFNVYQMDVPDKIAGDNTPIFGQKGDTFQLNASFEGEGSLPYIFWYSTDPTVATVDHNGLVTLRKNVVGDEPMALSTAEDEDENQAGATHCKIIATSLYRNIPPLEVNVGNIVETGVESILCSNYEKIDYTAPLEVYNLNGVRIGETVTGLIPGIYIVRQGSISIKIAVK